MNQTVTRRALSFLDRARGVSVLTNGPLLLCAKSSSEQLVKRFWKVKCRLDTKSKRTYCKSICSSIRV